jgi:hypothetical protein
MAIKTASTFVVAVNKLQILHAREHRLQAISILEQSRWSGSLPSIKNGSLGPSLTGAIRRSRIEVPRVDYEKLSSDRLGETSASIRARVQAARDIQTKRFSDDSSEIVCTADMHVGEIRQFCKLQRKVSV